MQIWLEQITLGKNWTFDNLRGIKKSADRNQIPFEEKQKPNTKKKKKNMKHFTRKVRMTGNQKLVYTGARMIINQVIVKQEPQQNIARIILSEKILCLKRAGVKH